MSAAKLQEALGYCWTSPAGWGDDTPAKPYCNRPAGHEPPHICHVVWHDSTDLKPSDDVLDAITAAFLDATEPKP
jgi:hypothetical protein